MHAVEKSTYKNRTKGVWKLARNFADTGEHYDIDLLIGSDCYWNFFTGKTLKGKNNTVIASESKFGWVLNGTVEKKTKEGENFTFANNIVHVCHIQVHLLNKLDSQMKGFGN